MEKIVRVSRKKERIQRFERKNPARLQGNWLRLRNGHCIQKLSLLLTSVYYTESPIIVSQLVRQLLKLLLLLAYDNPPKYK